MDCSPPGSSMHGIFQARILEWGATAFSRGSSRPRDWTQVSHIAGRRFNLTHQGSPSILKFPEHFLHFHVLTEAWLFPKNTPSWKKQESSRKTSISDLLTMPKPLTVWITTNFGKFWEMGIPDHLTCLLRNLYAGQEATVRTGHGTTDWFQIVKRIRQGCVLSPCLFNLYAEYIMRNAGLEETQVGIKIAGRNINNFRYTYDTTLMAESK